MAVDVPKIEELPACASPHSTDQTAKALGAVGLEDVRQKADFTGTV